MPDIPPETVTEEQYTDEHGHTVVKKVLPDTPRLGEGSTHIPQWGWFCLMKSMNQNFCTGDSNTRRVTLFTTSLSVQFHFT